MNEFEQIIQELDNEVKKQKEVCEDMTETSGWRIYEKAMSIAKEIVRRHMKDDWTSAEEQPPKGGKDIWYLVQVIGGEKPFMTLNYHEEYEMFGEIKKDRFLGEYIRGTAYKWRSLPEPYRPEEKDE